MLSFLASILTNDTQSVHTLTLCVHVDIIKLFLGRALMLILGNATSAFAQVWRVQFMYTLDLYVLCLFTSTPPHVLLPFPFHNVIAVCYAVCYAFMLLVYGELALALFSYIHSC